VADRHEWWQSAVLYQIYPRSFQDASGDGVGDLAGIRSRLDYLRWLEVDALWLSPIYPSPMADFGYDVSDYTDIDPLFGTLEEFDCLLREAHERGLKLLMDFVPNHTSDRHPWFAESRSSRDHPRRDWYIWRDPAPGGGPPNNWRSIFGGSAWELDGATGQYYYHAFLKEQPDLNWRNPEVAGAMFDVLRFWLRRGVDGFRVDVIWHVIKDDQFRDNPPNPDFKEGMPPHRQLLATYSTDRPEVHQVIAGMRQVLDEFPGRLLIGEIYLPVERLVTYYGAHGSDGVHLPFNFQLLLLPWKARVIDDAIRAYEAALPPHGWPNWVLGNHDRPRVATRVGGEAQARVAAVLLLTLRGTPTIYYGEELGMANVPIPPERVRDPSEKNQPGLGVGRDPCRTPMPWTAGQYAGFSTAEPWLPLADDYPTRNVEAQQADPGSILSLYRRLLELRRAEPALQFGHYAPLPAEGNLIAYVRRYGEKQFLVVLNLGPRPTRFTPPGPLRPGQIVLSTHPGRAGESLDDSLRLDGNEAVIVEFSGQ
jgi:alpha-glucosidase